MLVIDIDLFNIKHPKGEGVGLGIGGEVGEGVGGDVGWGVGGDVWLGVGLGVGLEGTVGQGVGVGVGAFLQLEVAQPLAGGDTTYDNVGGGK